MASFAQELVTVQRERLDLKAGLVGLVVLSVFGVAIALVGPVVMAAAIGALVLLSTDPPPAGRSWATALLPLIVGGAVVTFIAVSIGDQAVRAALLVGAVGVVATLLAGRSRKAGTRGLIATLWIILALTLGHTGVGALDYAVAFAVGAAVGAGVARSRARSRARAGAGAGSTEGTDDDDVETGRRLLRPRPSRRSSGARWGRSPSCVASASGSPSCSASPGSRRIPHGSPSAP